MNSTLASGTVRSARVGLSSAWLVLLLAAGCDQGSSSRQPSLSTTNTPASAAAPTLPETLEQLEARLDRTLWHDEMLALNYGSAFVTLRDSLRHSSNRLGVVANFKFQSISLPAPQKVSPVLDLSIREQSFENSRRYDMPYSAWAETLSGLQKSGWQLEQAEWNHIRFVPPSSEKPAYSEFSFHFHGERPPQIRFIVEGILGVEWASPSSNGPVSARHLIASNVTVLERSGRPGFDRTAIVTPNPPEASGQMVNLHPIIVTDVDRDGNDDVVLGGVNQLFINDGSGRFALKSFVDEPLFQGCRSAGVVADFNGDGLLDFMTIGAQPGFTNKLTLYAGNGTYPMSTPARIIAGDLQLLAASVITAGDIDHDGDLDLFVAQYKPPGIGGQLPTPYWDARDGYPSYLLVNDGNGNFAVATGNVALQEKRLRRTFAASFVDLDGDGDLDLLTVNDFAGVDIYYNQGTGEFLDESARLYNPHLFGMGHTFGDFDHDGVLDFLVTGMNLSTVQRLETLGLGRDDMPDRTRWRTEMTYGNRIYTLRDGKWVNPPFGVELAHTGWTWGVAAGDFDNDGDLDVYFANGHISGESVEDYDSHNWRHDVYLGNSREDRKLMYYFARTFNGINTGATSWMGHQHDCFLLDVGTNHYRDVAWLMDLAHEPDTRAVVAADLNNDGKLDLLVTDAEWMRGPQTGRNRLHIHLNQLPSVGSWIGAKLFAERKRVSPIGAKIRLKTGDRTIPAQIVTGDSYQSQHPFRAHFGLKPGEQAQELVVEWPNGTIEKVDHPQSNKYYEFGRQPVSANR